MLAVAALLCAAVLAPTPPANAATPSEGTISKPNDEVEWDGGPFFVSNPTLCVGADDPTCDHFILKIEANGVKNVLVAIAPDEGFEDDDYDLFVFDDQGNQVGSDTSPDGFESVIFEHTGSSFYEVRVQPWLVESGSTYSGVAMRTQERPVDVEIQDCVELVPESVAVDDGQPIELSVLLLLDGTDRAVAEQLFLVAAESYLPHTIDLVVERMREVSFTSTTSDELIQESKDAVGGTRPKGIDIVGTLTDKTMQAFGGGFTVVGQADCIGGIRFDDRSFFVATDIRDSEDPDSGTSGALNALGFNPNVDAAAEVIAHEIGHLMGAHHHYANCVEGNLTSRGVHDLSPCTLMFNCVCFASLNFSELSGVVVRGHAVDFAQ